MLPWLRLDGETTFGKVKLAPLAVVSAALGGEIRDTVAILAATFRDQQDRPVEPAICWLADRHPTALLSDDDVDVLREHLYLGALAAIAANEYLTHRQQINASHFQRIYQHFLPGTKTVALVRRRRDGHILLGGVQIANLRETIPTPATETATPHWEQPFLDSLASTVDADDSTSTLLRQSLPLFLQGSELDEWGTHSQDVVWIGSAVEQMCDVSGNRKNQQMAEKITATLGAEWDAPQKRAVRSWMDEFYAKRSEIHGRAAGRDAWPYWGHALLGTVTYVLLIRHLLAAEGRYALTDQDGTNAAALPHRIGCLKDADAQEQDDFARCWREGAWEGAMARIIRRFSGGDSPAAPAD